MHHTSADLTENDNDDAGEPPSALHCHSTMHRHSTLQPKRAVLLTWQHRHSYGAGADSAIAARNGVGDGRGFACKAWGR